MPLSCLIIFATGIFIEAKIDVDIQLYQEWLSHKNTLNTKSALNETSKFKVGRYGTLFIYKGKPPTLKEHSYSYWKRLLTRSKDRAASLHNFLAWTNNLGIKRDFFLYQDKTSIQRGLFRQMEYLRPLCNKQPVIVSSTYLDHAKQKGARIFSPLSCLYCCAAPPLGSTAAGCAEGWVVSCGASAAGCLDEKLPQAASANAQTKDAIKALVFFMMEFLLLFLSNRKSSSASNEVKAWTNGTAYAGRMPILSQPSYDPCIGCKSMLVADLWFCTFDGPIFAPVNNGAHSSIHNNLWKYVFSFLDKTIRFLSYSNYR